MPEVKVTVTPQTPFWTGNAQQKSVTVRESGILGSLRWWYEAVIRGLGLFACDPTDAHRCLYDSKDVKNVCLACQLFGCTGLGRSFRIEVVGDAGAGGVVTVRRKPPPNPNHKGWPIPNALGRPFQLIVRPLRMGRVSPFDAFATNALYLTLRFIERYGALGARTSQGQGVVKVDWSGWGITGDLEGWIGEARRRPSRAGQQSQSLPSLSDFLGFTVTLDSNDTKDPKWAERIPLSGSPGAVNKWFGGAQAVRVVLREWLRNSGNVPGFKGDLRQERHRILGTVARPVGPKGSDVFVTHLHRADGSWKMRVFGFLQDSSPVQAAFRSFLLDANRVTPPISTALGGLTPQIDYYPQGADQLLR